jgi:hypothetical protein
MHHAPLFTQVEAMPSKSRIPHWQQLNPNLREALLGVLTQIVKHHAPRLSAANGRGVPDDSR